MDKNWVFLSIFSLFILKEYVMRLYYTYDDESTIGSDGYPRFKTCFEACEIGYLFRYVDVKN